MNFKRLTTITGVFFALIGLVFAFGPTWEALRALGLPNFPSPPVKEWWLLETADPYFRMWGLTLFGFGLLIWSVRNLHDPKPRANINLAIFITCALVGASMFGAGWMFPKPATKAMLLSFLLFAMAYGYLLFTKASDKQPSREQAHTNLRESWAKQISAAAAQQERNRLARDLHDSIKQQLFSINIGAATVQARWETDHEGALTALGDVRQSAHEAMAEMEAMLHHLRPAPLDCIGLVEALRQQCESLQYRTGAAVITQIGELPESNGLPLGAQEAIFRIVQEAFANIARHARADNVELRMYQQEDDENGMLWLKIKDDGAGFNPAWIVEGMGLSNIRTRAAEVGGEAQIESRPSEGTSIIVKIPLVVTDSVEIKHHLRNTAIIVAAGFFVSPFMAVSHGKDGLFNLLLGIPVFGIAVMGYLRAHRTLSRARDANAISRKSFLRLKRYESPTLALLYLVISSWMIVWIGPYLLFGRVRESFYAPILILSAVTLPFYELYRLHQTFREEYRFSSPQAFYRSLKPMCLQSTAILAGMLMFIGYYLEFAKRSFFLLSFLFLIITYCGCIAWWLWKASTRVPRGEFSL